VRVPLSWLREFCPTELPIEEIAERLTAQGVEVAGIIRPWERLSGVVVARVVDVRDHPEADRLCLATVDSGGGEREVVVGVRNMGPGDFVPYAGPGSMLPGVEGALERRQIRGVVSDGMLCSPRELGISQDHSGILVLPDGAQPGEDLKERLGLDDAVLDVEVFPNRPDLLSVVGVAREVAAASGEEFAVPDSSGSEGKGRAEATASVEVRDPEGCPRFVARVIRGVTLGPSPLHAQIRLTAAGMRPLANVVDATNYVMLETGQPLHAFDLAKVADARLIVRRAAGGEQMRTLDGIDRTFTEEDLLVTDERGPLGIAGVIGGEESEVSETTTEVLLECANWDPVSVLRTARKFGLRTEASIRFERGADPEAPPLAAARCAALMADWAGGEVLSGAIDVGGPPERRTVGLRPARASVLIGVEVSDTDAAEALERLRLPVKRAKREITVEVPGYRVDLDREADLIEEVARIRGYDLVESTLPGIRQVGGLSPSQRARRRLLEAFVRAGLYETHAPSVSPAGDARLFTGDSREAPRIANPISEEEGWLRVSLIPGLLRATRRSIAHRRTAVRLFEVGDVFWLEGGDVVEVEGAACVLTGPAGEEWPAEKRDLDALDAKGVLTHVLETLGVRSWSLEVPAGPPYHPGRSAAVLLNGRRIGNVGELAPSVSREFDIDARVAVLDLMVGPVVESAVEQVPYREISRFPPVRRDLAFVVDRDLPAGAVRDGLVATAGELLDRLVLFDVFEGPPLPEGKKSLAFALDFRAADRTLTDQEAEELVGRIAGRLVADLGVELRTG
jgi:phenylalanyl-tRNA synthetase beta chain